MSSNDFFFIDNIWYVCPLLGDLSRTGLTSLTTHPPSAKVDCSRISIQYWSSYHWLASFAFPSAFSLYIRELPETVNLPTTCHLLLIMNPMSKFGSRPVIDGATQQRLLAFDGNKAHASPWKRGTSRLRPIACVHLMSLITQAASTNFAVCLTRLFTNGGINK